VSKAYPDLMTPMSDVTMWDFSHHPGEGSMDMQDNPVRKLPQKAAAPPPSYNSAAGKGGPGSGGPYPSPPPPYGGSVGKPTPPSYSSTAGPQNMRPFSNPSPPPSISGKQSLPPPSYQDAHGPRSVGKPVPQNPSPARPPSYQQVPPPYQGPGHAHYQPSSNYPSPPIVYAASNASNSLELDFNGNYPSLGSRSSGASPNLSNRSSGASPQPPSYGSASQSHGGSGHYQYSSPKVPPYGSVGYNSAPPPSYQDTSATQRNSAKFQSPNPMYQDSARSPAPPPPAYKSVSNPHSQGPTTASASGWPSGSSVANNASARCPVDIYSHPKQWFQYFDKDNSGSLDKEECINGLASTFHSVDRGSIESILTAVWDYYDPMHTGFVTLTQFTRSDGMCDMILQQFPREATRSAGSSPANISTSASAAPSKTSNVEKCPIDIYTQPKQWFQYFDRDNSGSLDKDECINGLAATFVHVDRDTIASVLAALWSQFDPRHTGYVTMAQFTKKDGLCETIVQQFPPQNRKPVSHHQAGKGSPSPASTPNPCPYDIYTQPKQWFQYFDKDSSGSLDKDECKNGFACTFLHVDREVVVSVVDAIWDQFDPRHTGYVTLAQFTKSGGLCEMITSQFPKDVVNTARKAHQQQQQKQQKQLSVLVPCPVDIYAQPKQWFQFFDKDNSGSLDREECTNGLATTFQHVDRETIESVLTALWDQFDPSRTGYVTLQQFTRRDGLCETILSQLPRKPAVQRTASAENMKRNSPGKPATPSGLLTSVGSFFMNSARGGSTQKAHHHKGLGAHKAVIIGINYYGTPAQLKHGVNDAEQIKKLLMEHYGWQEKDIRLFHDKTRDMKIRPNKDNILKALRWLVKDASPGDTLFLFFSGHAFQEENIDANVDDDATMDDDEIAVTNKSFLECVVPGNLVITQRFSLSAGLFLRFCS
jgi:Ca2+-binding EF-hand superfamily protein